MNTLMRPDFRPKFNPGEVPVGSITWFVGTQERFSQLMDSGNWIVCNGGSTVIDPDGEGRELFETLGGQYLRSYLAGESPSSVLEKVSPLLTHVHSYEVLDGFRGFSVSNRLRQVNGSSVGEDIGVNGSAASATGEYWVPSSSFRNLGDDTLSSVNAKWAHGSSDQPSQWGEGVELSWPIYVFNACFGLTFVPGPDDVWYVNRGAVLGHVRELRRRNPGQRLVAPGGRRPVAVQHKRAPLRQGARGVPGGHGHRQLRRAPRPLLLQ